MFAQFEHYRTNHVVEMVAFEIDNRSVCNERVYLKAMHGHDDRFQRFTYGGTCEFIEHARYVDTGKTKIEMRAKFACKEELRDLLARIEADYPFFKTSYVERFLFIDKVDVSRLIITYVLDTKMEVERVSLYLWPETGTFDFFKRHAMSPAFDHEMFSASCVGMKFAPGRVYSKAYFARKKEAIAFEEEAFAYALSELGCGIIEAPFADYHFFGIGIPLEEHADSRVAFYFYPKQEGVHTVELKTNVIVRSVGGKTLLIDQKKRYDKDPDIAMVNTMGAAICNILANHDMRTVDYISDLISAQIIDFDGSPDYYGKIFKMVQGFIEGLEEKSLVVAWRD